MRTEDWVDQAGFSVEQVVDDLTSGNATKKEIIERAVRFARAGHYGPVVNNNNPDVISRALYKILVGE